MRDFFPNRAAAVLLTGASLVSAGCGLGPFGNKKQPRVFIPPPPAVVTMPELTLPQIPPPPDIQADLSSSYTLVLAVVMPTLPAPPEAPLPPPAKPKPAVPGTVAETPPPAPERPKLSQIFTPDDERAFNKELDDILGRVRGFLAYAAGKNLSTSQREQVDRIRTLQAQAEQARRQDLQTAVNFARRADALAKDLAGRL